MVRSQHGADLVGTMQRYRTGGKELTDFSSNVNVFFSSRLETCLSNVKVGDLLRYPDIHYRYLKEKIAKRYDVDVEEVLVGNGATELIYLVARHRDFSRIGVLHPTFSEYERAAFIAGKEVISLYLKDDFELGEYEEEIKDLDLLFVCNPNNPNGKLKDLRALVEVCRKNDCTLCVDETFLEFSYREEEYSLLPLLKEYSNLIVLRALTKVYGLAGIRLGYLFTDRETVFCLEDVQEPWSIHAFADNFIDVIFDQELIDKTKRFYRQETKFMYDELSKIRGVRPHPTDVNFILFDLSGDMSAEELKRNLIEQEGILVRECSDYRGLGSDFVRVNIKDRERNLILLRAIEKTLGDIGRKRG